MSTQPTYGKTLEGQAALRRHGGMTPRQRAALILFDGTRTAAQVVASTRIDEAEIALMVSLGYLIPIGGKNGV